MKDNPDSLDSLVKAKQYITDYKEQTGCRLCTLKAEAIVELLDEFIEMHNKAHAFVDAVENSKYLKLIGA